MIHSVLIVTPEKEIAQLKSAARMGFVKETVLINSFLTANQIVKKDVFCLRTVYGTHLVKSLVFVSLHQIVCWITLPILFMDKNLVSVIHKIQVNAFLNC